MPLERSPGVPCCAAATEVGDACWSAEPSPPDKVVDVVEASAVGLPLASIAPSDFGELPEHATEKVDTNPMRAKSPKICSAFDCFETR